jgi:1-acyl-sn-glycerol-3-phosphate acyltransferase
MAWLCLKIDSEGLERIPKNGPLLIVINHLGHADTPTIMSSLPFMPDALGGIELHDVPILGILMDWYGIIWLHRGRADKRALRAALDGLSQGRVLIIAPEGRYSLTGALEQGTTGAAFLAMKSGAPILPIALVGTENSRVFGYLKRFKRAPVQLRVGEMFKLENQESARHEALSQGTEQIMEALANLLPEQYRGEYS